MLLPGEKKGGVLGMQEFLFKKAFISLYLETDSFACVRACIVMLVN